MAQGFNYPLLSDVDHAVGKAYGAERDPDDKFPAFARRLTFLIRPDGTIAKVYTVTDVESHPDEVLEDIRALS